ncbi:MAG TPA: transcription termination factor NusA [Candidatus Paceibacterota bacterium]|nr:transcription termination factor NusA [Candidatus Paceibacterota bacterium]
MLNVKDLIKAVKQVAEEKSLEPDKVIEAIESSLAAAYKKEYGTRGEIVRAKLDMKTGAMKFWRMKTVVDETTVRIVEKKEGEEDPVDDKEWRERVGIPREEPEEGDGEFKLPRYNPERHILLADAKEIKSDAVLGEEIEFPLETHEDFGRIAAQTAKQAVFQKLRESERDSILKEWRGKEGQIVSGMVQRFERGHVYIDLGRAVGVMFQNESVPGEHYRNGERLRFYVLAVQEDTRLPGIILSRAHPKFVSKLFELEVPEVADGAVEIKLIAREPGSRTKLAVVSKADGVDPVGALVGQRGTRVMAVNNELGQEKIDIIEYSEDPETFIANAISPAKAQSVEILPHREARVYVAEDQLSLAIGRGGQNVRLAAKLTGWKIDVRSQAKPEEAIEGGVSGVAEEVAAVIPPSDSDDEGYGVS